MKRMKVAVAVGVLLAMAPVAVPKGKQGGSSLTFDVSCDGSDQCVVNAGGLTGGKLYEIQMVDNCSSNSRTQTYTASTTGTIADAYDLSGLDGCSSGDNWSFYLYTYGNNGNRLQLVASRQVTEAI